MKNTRQLRGNELYEHLLLNYPALAYFYATSPDQSQRAAERYRAVHKETVQRATTCRAELNAFIQEVVESKAARALVDLLNQQEDCFSFWRAPDWECLEVKAGLLRDLREETRGTE